MRDAMRDDARLPAARAREDEDRAFGSFNRFTLRRIQTGKKIHELPFSQVGQGFGPAAGLGARAEL
jgi:hypothetical protein